VAIDAAYIAANAPIIREQLLKSGVRLAHLLDAAMRRWRDRARAADTAREMFGVNWPTL
jgi:hypothetical protein